MPIFDINPEGKVYKCHKCPAEFPDKLSRDSHEMWNHLGKEDQEQRPT